MSFKCSIFGHSFGETEVEREREEDGNEVVITIRETETCERCGEQRVVSENKEVTTLETAADIVAEDLAEEEPTEQSNGTAETTVAESAETSGAEPEPEPEIPDAETGEPATASSEGAVQTATAPAPEPEEDDAVILEEEEPETEPETDDERDPGEWPEEPEEDDDDWQPATTPASQALENEPEVEPTDDAVTVPEGTFHCPECDFTTPVEESSLREGDFCPECHRGSLEHHSE